MERATRHWTCGKIDLQAQTLEQKSVEAEEKGRRVAWFRARMRFKPKTSSENQCAFVYDVFACFCFPSTVYSFNCFFLHTMSPYLVFRQVRTFFNVVRPQWRRAETRASKAEARLKSSLQEHGDVGCQKLNTSNEHFQT